MSVLKVEDMSFKILDEIRSIRGWPVFLWAGHSVADVLQCLFPEALA
jgi:hypothetical protein